MVVVSPHPPAPAQVVVGPLFVVSLPPMEQLSWIIPTSVTLLLALGGGLLYHLRHIDQCMHRMENNLNEKIDDLAQRMARMEGPIR